MHFVDFRLGNGGKLKYSLKLKIDLKDIQNELIRFESFPIINMLFGGSGSIKIILSIPLITIEGIMPINCRLY